ncbi:recombinase family protein [Shimia sp.]|uniref:recombinase family protein n=1 Tax=Shimia sp. TaxID=1954381 RepID=UPI00329A0E6E
MSAFTQALAAFHKLITGEFMTRDFLAAPAGSRAVLYMRVSTGQQAQNDLSIPDQKKQLRSHCKHHAYIIAGEYSDAKSGRDDNRPGFQTMLEDIKHGGLGCDIILVHSYSRFFRDEVMAELHIRSLAKRGIRLISLTQRTDDSSEGQILRRILAIFDEYTSLETAKHVRRSLHENALQGFWNGGTTPFGYRVVEVGRRGKTLKKGLEVNETEAETVRLMFTLALKGDGTTGPLGIKKIVSWLNERGYKTRNSSRWGVSAVHRRLTDSIYTGVKIFHSGENGGVEIPIAVPSIVSEHDFENLRVVLAEKNPKKAPPRVVSGDVLLTGLVVCPNCGGGMTTSTGKSGRYRYYACSNRMRTGSIGCEGRRVPMEAMDELITTALKASLFTFDKVNEILSPLRERQSRSAEDLEKRLVDRETEVQEAKRKMDNLYSMIEAGVVEAADAAFKDRFQDAKSEFQRAQKERDQIAQEIAPQNRINHDKIVKFVASMQNALNSESIANKRAYIRAAVDAVEVGEDSIQIYGRREQIERAVALESVAPSPVPTFVRGWRRRWDSNPRRALTLVGFQDPKPP